MSSNQRLSELLESIASMMELLGADSFRTAAFAKAARAVADQSQEVITLADDKAKLLALPGIGKSMADRIIEFAQTGTLAEAAELAGQLPPGLLELTTIPGVGPKSVRSFWKDGNITNLDQLKKAIDDGSLAKLPRMGEKSVAKIKANLPLLNAAAQRTWLGKASVVADRVTAFLKTLADVEQAVPAGSLRRGKETIGDIDVLVSLTAGPDAKLEARQLAVAEAFRTMPDVVHVIASGANKSSVRVALDGKTGRWKTEDESAATSIQVDLRILPASSFGAGMMYFTGSKEHNVRLRERALKAGWTLNEWGLFPNDDEPTPPQSRGVKALASATEEEIYAKFGLPWIAPELREDRGELELTEAPKLIEVGDVKAELHAHTTASDGAMSIEELAEKAKERGFHTIAVTDHSKGQPVAGGLSIERMLQHIEDIAKAKEKVKEIRLLAGSEVDILADGTLDYPDEILKQLDVVVASPHNGLNQDPQSATRRLIAAIRHPLVHIIGHPTGRLINRRNGLSPDMGALFAAAKESNTALEINAHWMRLDLRDIHVRAALEAGCVIAINCDVHAPDDYSNLRFGVATGRRGGLTAERCINTWEAARLHAWLAAKR